jgi:hypothetical protein
MTKTITTLLSIALLICTQAFAQKISDFDDVTLPAKGYYNGNDWKGGFNSGPNFFVNEYDTAFGFESWGGFAVSNIKDSVNKGFINQYASIAGGGYQSEQYAVVYGDAKVRMNASAPFTGFFICNTTYTYYDMKEGSQFSKKFGGASGNDPDFLKVIISGWKNGGNPADTAIEFYLADYRNSDNSKDYIVKSWTYVDLSALGMVDSLGFNFASSDTGDFGINTPVYFCMDRLAQFAIGLNDNKQALAVTAYPNPATENLRVDVTANEVSLQIYNLQGSLVAASIGKEIKVGELTSGVYLLLVQTEKGNYSQKIIKQ